MPGDFCDSFTEEVTFKLNLGGVLRVVHIKQKARRGHSQPVQTWEAPTAWHGVQGLYILLCRVLVDGALGDKTKGQTAMYPIL